jgi:hypothetical protein
VCNCEGVFMSSASCGLASLNSRLKTLNFLCCARLLPAGGLHV